MGGELALLVERVNFSCKQELIELIKNLRGSTKLLPRIVRGELIQTLNVSLGQTYYTTEKELLRYKRFLNNNKMEEY